MSEHHATRAPFVGARTSRAPLVGARTSAAPFSGARVILGAALGLTLLAASLPAAVAAQEVGLFSCVRGDTPVRSEPVRHL